MTTDIVIDCNNDRLVVDREIVMKLKRPYEFSLALVAVFEKLDTRDVMVSRIDEDTYRTIYEG